MSTHDKDIVSALRLAIAERVGHDRFELWFGESTRFVPATSTVRVEVPNQFTLEWLRNNFRSPIESAVTEVLGDSFAVEFFVCPSLGAAAANPASSGRPDSDRRSGKPCTARPHAPKEDRRDNVSRRRFASLDSLVLGDCNRVAITSANFVLRQLGAVSPLYVYGPTGVGKTHLLEGIWSAIRRMPGRRRVVYLSGEQFTTYFLEALQGKGLPSFRHRYRDVDVLLIDGIQFFSGKRVTLIELQQTIDALLREGRQLVLAADRPPAELSDFGPELIARFSGGLVCAIQTPDFETRIGMLRIWVTKRRLEVPSDVLHLIAERLPHDARQLIGALNRLEATAQALGQTISRSMAEVALADLFQSMCRTVRLEDIERAVCDVFGLERRTLKSDSRAKMVSHPRMLAMWLARKHTRAALSEIGSYFGRRSHATVVSAQKAVNRWRADGAAMHLTDRDCGIDETIQQIETKIRAG